MCRSMCVRSYTAAHRASLCGLRSWYCSTPRLGAILVQDSLAGLAGAEGLGQVLVRCVPGVALVQGHITRRNSCGTGPDEEGGCARRMETEQRKRSSTEERKPVRMEVDVGTCTWFVGPDWRDWQGGPGLPGLTPRLSRTCHSLEGFRTPTVQVLVRSSRSCLPGSPAYGTTQTQSSLCYWNPSVAAAAAGDESPAKEAG